MPSSFEEVEMVVVGCSACILVFKASTGYITVCSRIPANAPAIHCDVSVAPSGSDS